MSWFTNLISRFSPASKSFQTFTRGEIIRDNRESMQNVVKLLPTGKGILDKREVTYNTPNAAETPGWVKEAKKRIDAGKGPALELINSKLSDNPNVKAIQAEIIENLHKTRAWLENPEHHPEAIVSVLQQTVSNAYTELKKEQEIEVANLKALFKDEAFVEQIMKDLQPPKQAKGSESLEASEVEALMESALKKTHEAELDTFQKTLNEGINKMHNFISEEGRRISNAYFFYQANQKMIDELIRNNEPHASQTTASFGKTGKFANIKISDLPIIYTETGNKIKIKDGNIFQIELARENLLGIFYYGVFRDSPLKDLRALAIAVKDTKADSIQMTINHKNPQETEELVKRAYRACIEAGFPPDKITIKVNDHVVTGPAKTAKEGEYNYNLERDAGEFLKLMATRGTEIAKEEKIALGANEFDKRAAENYLQSNKTTPRAKQDNHQGYKTELKNMREADKKDTPGDLAKESLDNLQVSQTKSGPPS